VAFALATASSASAARPHKNARYVGFEGSERVMELTQVTARVRMSASGRRFRRGSGVTVTCGNSERRVSLAGVDIDAGSLTLNGSTLTWRKGGATQSATLN
jgi:hypothetical protein